MPISLSADDAVSGGGSFGIQDQDFEAAKHWTGIHDYGKGKGPFPALYVAAFLSADQAANDPEVLILSAGDINKLIPVMVNPDGSQYAVPMGSQGNSFDLVPGVPVVKGVNDGLPENSKAGAYLFSIQPFRGKACSIVSELDGLFMHGKEEKVKTEFKKKDTVTQIETKEAGEYNRTIVTAVYPAPKWTPHVNVTLPAPGTKRKPRNAGPAAAAAPAAMPAAAAAVPMMVAPAAIAPAAIPAMAPVAAVAAVPVAAAPAPAPVSQFAQFLVTLDSLVINALSTAAASGIAQMTVDEARAKAFQAATANPGLAPHVQGILGLAMDPSYFGTEVHTAPAGYPSGFRSAGGVVRLG